MRHLVTQSLTFKSKLYFCCFDRFLATNSATVVRNLAVVDDTKVIDSIAEIVEAGIVRQIVDTAAQQGDYCCIEVQGVLGNHHGEKQHCYMMFAGFIEGTS